MLCVILICINSIQESNVINSNEFNRIRIVKQYWDEKRNFLIRKFSSIFDRFELEIIENFNLLDETTFNIQEKIKVIQLIWYLKSTKTILNNQNLYE